MTKLIQVGAVGLDLRRRKGEAMERVEKRESPSMYLKTKKILKIPKTWMRIIKHSYVILKS